MDNGLNGLFFGINYWAVVSAGLAAFFVGGLWYSPVLFEPTWIRLHGYSAQQVQAMQSAGAFVATALSYLVMALVFALLLRALGISDPGKAMLVGLAIWLGFVATSGLASNLFSNKPIGAWLIDAGFQLTFLLLTGLILGLWKSQ